MNTDATAATAPAPNAEKLTAPVTPATRALSATVEYFRRSGDSTAADALAATLSEHRTPGTVCVIGRAGAGRSTLVNTLVGAPAAFPASPAGVGTVTTAPVHVDADLDGAPVTFIDLPGTGVTSSGPEGTADLFLTQADLALFVVDAHIPLTPTEIDALTDARRLAPDVDLVVTKRDQNLRAVDSVLDRNRRSLAGAEHTDGQAQVPMHVVSGLPGIADPGITTLRQRISGRTTTTGDAAVRQALILVDREIDRQNLLAETSDTRSDPALADIDTRLAELTELPRNNRTFLTDRLSAARGSAVSRHSDDLADLHRRWRSYIETTRPAQILDDPDPVVARLSGELTRVKQDALGRLMRAVRSDFLEFTQGSGRWEEVTRQIAVSWSAATGDGAMVRADDRTPEKARFSELVSPSLLTVTVSGGGAIAYAASLLPGVGGMIAATGGLAALPVVAAAGGWLTVNLLHTAAGKGRRNLRSWLDDTVAAARRDLARDIDEVFHQIRPVVLTRYQSDMTRYVSSEKERLSALRTAVLAGQKTATESRDLAARRVAHLTTIKEMLA